MSDLVTFEEVVRRLRFTNINIYALRLRAGFPAPVSRSAATRGGYGTTSSPSCGASDSEFRRASDKTGARVGTLKRPPLAILVVAHKSCAGHRIRSRSLRVRTDHPTPLGVPDVKGRRRLDLASDFRAGGYQREHQT
jgi:hypothetical protein